MQFMYLWVRLDIITRSYIYREVVVISAEEVLFMSVCITVNLLKIMIALHQSLRMHAAAPS